MRVLCSGLIFAALTVPAALAQRVDTRRIDVEAITIPHYGAPGYECRFNAVPDLHLQHSTDGASVKAGLALPAEGTAPGKAMLNITYPQLAGAPFGVGPPTLLFIFGAPTGTLTRSETTARLSLDGTVIEPEMRVQEDKTGRNFAIGWPPAAKPPLADQLAEGRLATIEMVDTKGATVSSYSWDVHRLRDIPELLDLVHWGCVTPDRG